MDEGTKTILVDTAKIAMMTSLSTAAVRRLARRGEWPFYRAGRLMRFDPEEILAVMRNSNPSEDER